MRVNLTPAQALAYDQLLPFLEGRHEACLAVLEGYAGTGKTFLVARLLGALTGLKIAVAAPTNKAVRVLRDKLAEVDVEIAESGDANDGWKPRLPVAGCTCRSIHSLLGLKLKELENGQQEAVAERDSSLRHYDIVVVDECSMLDEFLFKKIVMERGRAQVLFVGDPAQLPPVSKQGVSLSPVFDRIDLKVRLTEVVRQARDNPIIALSIRLRQLIEAGVKATALNLAEALPDLTTYPKAALVGGTPDTLVEWWLSQRQDEPESDVRIIAYTNDRVQRYNRAIHQALYGATALRFVVGERVIVHTQCQAEHITGHFTEEARLITSDELIVASSEIKTHPIYPRMPAECLLLRGMDDELYQVWVPQDEEAWQRDVSACFTRFRDYKAQSARAESPEDRQSLKDTASDWSAKGWALLRAFASIRHAYAITCHKSQGSTFDCALVDFTDLAKMPDAFQFNRALYVAATRSREYLALVVT